MNWTPPSFSPDKISKPSQRQDAQRDSNTNSNSHYFLGSPVLVVSNNGERGAWNYCNGWTDLCCWLRTRWDCKNRIDSFGIQSWNCGDKTSGRPCGNMILVICLASWYIATPPSPPSQSRSVAHDWFKTIHISREEMRWFSIKTYHQHSVSGRHLCSSLDEYRHRALIPDEAETLWFLNLSLCKMWKSLYF